ncbi:unnamed protein product [Paramecium octaurelia]|uniref:CRAL-TRIO domain-containing protein n=1 Tax=Paramecium octaurelia TaxID=43137 RepID=A0A8S1TSI3_PAROT|nr:unnamed protein product [Paramecium octaurelia]
MGNFENTCLSRENSIKISDNKDRPSQFQRQHASEKTRNSFLHSISIQVVQYYSKMYDNNFDPFSATLTAQIIELSKHNNCLDLSLCRYLLVSQHYNFEKINLLIRENQEFRQSIRPIEYEPLRQAIQIIGIDFKKGLVLCVKLDKINTEYVQQYFLYFLEYLFYEIATNNKLNNHIVIVYDLQQESANPIFLNFIANLTYKHYFLNVRKLILINISLEKISSEVIGMLSQGSYSYLILPLSDISYLQRYVKKSELSKDYGGMFQKKRNPIPLNYNQAVHYKL